MIGPILTSGRPGWPARLFFIANPSTNRIDQSLLDIAYQLPDFLVAAPALFLDHVNLVAYLKMFNMNNPELFAVQLFFDGHIGEKGGPVTFEGGKLDGFD